MPEHFARMTESDTFQTFPMLDGSAPNNTLRTYPDTVTSMSDYVPATTVWNFNVGANMGDEEQFRVEGWWSNFTDETYSGKAFINDSVNIRFLNPPSMWGIRAIYRW